MKTRSDMRKKQYGKPRLTRVSLSVEQRVLQSCRSLTEFNMSGWDYPDCHEMEACWKTE
jgi:hypothetical protein